MKRYFKNAASRLSSLKLFNWVFVLKNFLLAGAKHFSPCHGAAVNMWRTWLNLKFRQAANWDRLEWGDLLANSWNPALQPQNSWFHLDLLSSSFQTISAGRKMTASVPSTDMSERLYILGHQVFFLLSGLCQTLGAQWLFYSGAASRDPLELYRTARNLY